MTANDNALLAQSISLLMIIYTGVHGGGGGGGGGGIQQQCTDRYADMLLCTRAAYSEGNRERRRLLELRRVYHYCTYKLTSSSYIPSFHDPSALTASGTS